MTRAIQEAGFKRNEIFITNIVKCRPPENRTPTLEEAQLGKKLILQHELEIINPKVIVPLGLCALQGLTEEAMSMSRVRGTSIPFNNSLLFPTYHPAYVLRNPTAGETFFADIKKALLMAHE